MAKENAQVEELTLLEVHCVGCVTMHKIDDELVIKCQI